MSLPRIEEFKSRIKAESQEKRDRDYNILELLSLQPELTQEETIALLGIELSQGHVSTIIRENMKLYLEMVLYLNPLAVKEGRILELIKHYRRKHKQGTKKDIADLLEQLRKEIEGNSPLVKIEEHTHFTNIKQVIEFASKRQRIKIDV